MDSTGQVFHGAALLHCKWPGKIGLFSRRFGVDPDQIHFLYHLPFETFQVLSGVGGDRDARPLFLEKFAEDLIELFSWLIVALVDQYQEWQESHRLPLQIAALAILGGDARFLQ